MNKQAACVLAMLMAAVIQGLALDLGRVRYHDEARDTARINDILIEVGGRHLPTNGDVIVAIAECFMGVPYVGHTLEGTPEMLTVNIDELDCTTYVETVLALALTLDERRGSWRDFLYNLERVRYRGGHMDGYPSRLHYNSDWAVDNMHRGNIIDATPLFPKYTYAVRTLDFMSSNADKYAALADSATLALIKDVELGYRGHRFPYIKTGDLANKLTKSEFRNGDIVGLVTNIKNLDCSHLGIIKVIDGEPYLMHASLSAGRVVTTEQPLCDYMKRNRGLLGVRVYRMAE